MTPLSTRSIRINSTLESSAKSGTCTVSISIFGCPRRDTWMNPPHLPHPLLSLSSSLSLLSLYPVWKKKNPPSGNPDRVTFLPSNNPLHPCDVGQTVGRVSFATSPPALHLSLSPSLSLYALSEAWARWRGHDSPRRAMLPNDTNGARAESI